MKLLMIDNYDSFTFNLIQLFGEFEIETEVYRHDQVTIEQISKIQPDWICISPGPKAPQQAGISLDVINHFSGHVPILGVCLGMQAINEAFGGKTVKAPVPVHGKRSLIEHNGKGVFANLPSPFHVARYHSLAVDNVSDSLEITARTEDGVIMGLQHRLYPVFGVQFHPESFISQYGLEIAANFLRTVPEFKAEINLDTENKHRFPRWDDCDAIMPDAN